MTTVTQLPLEQRCDHCRQAEGPGGLVSAVYELFESPTHNWFHDQCFVSGTWAARYSLLENAFGFLPYRGPRQEALRVLGVDSAYATAYGLEIFVSRSDDPVGIVNVYPWMMEQVITDLVYNARGLSFRPIFDPPWNWGVSDLVTLVVSGRTSQALVQVQQFLTANECCGGCGGMIGQSPPDISYGFAGRGGICCDECHTRVREWIWLDVADDFGLVPRMSPGFCIHLLGQSWSDHVVDQHLRTCKLLGRRVGASLDHSRHWRVVPGSPLEPLFGAHAMVATSEPYADNADVDLGAFAAEGIAAQLIRYDSLPIHSPSKQNKTVLFVWGADISHDAEPRLLTEPERGVA